MVLRGAKVEKLFRREVCQQKKRQEQTLGNLQGWPLSILVYVSGFVLCTKKTTLLGWHVVLGFPYVQKKTFPHSDIRHIHLNLWFQSLPIPAPQQGALCRSQRPAGFGTIGGDVEKREGVVSPKKSSWKDPHKRRETIYEIMNKWEKYTCCSTKIIV